MDWNKPFNSRETLNFKNQNTSMQKSSLCDYSDTYILVSGTITVTRGPDNKTDPNSRRDKKRSSI